MAEDDYERGKVQGVVDAKLAEHTAHLDKINGSMQVVADKLTEVSMTLQRLADTADADRRTAVATAAALKAAEEAKWTPKAKLISVLVAIAVTAAAVVSILAFVLR